MKTFNQQVKTNSGLGVSESNSQLVTRILERILVQMWKQKIKAALQEVYASYDAEGTLNGILELLDLLYPLF